MTRGRVAVILDNEALQALLDSNHRKHHRVFAHLNVNRATRFIVPSAVKVEAGWDRRVPAAATVNRLALEDFPLDSGNSDIAARIRASLRVSVADAHIGAVLASVSGPHSVLTSDPDDVTRIAGYLQIPVNVVTL